MNKVPATPFQQFNHMVRAWVRSETVVLHAGCGDDVSLGIRELVEKVIGIDLDVRGISNLDLDAFVVSDVSDIPLVQNSVDFIVARWVLEHIEKPERFFSEAQRVLRPGGHFILLTPNAWHYAGAIIRFTPHWFHKFFVEKILHGEPGDVFPTYYKANTLTRLKKLANETDLTFNKIVLIEGEPTLLRFSCILYSFGMLYKRLVDRFDILKTLRSAIIVVLQNTV